MYCPSCGQQQVSEEMKFCSQCGFPLGLVSEILAHGGFLPQLAELYKSKKWLTRKNGIVFSILWCMFFLFILSPIFSAADIFELAAASAVIGIFGGLMWLITTLVLVRSEPKKFNFPTNELPNSGVNTFYETSQKVLPSDQTQTAQSYIAPEGAWKALNTGKFAQPRSVTESTTKLLQKEDE